MNEMKIITSIYFEVKDAKVFGGVGTIGYVEQNIDFTVTEENPKIFKESAHDFVKKSIADIAKHFQVNDKCVRTITKCEYEICTNLS